MKIKNNLDKDLSLEITGLFYPVLSKMEDDISHPAFNNMFLKYSTSKSGDLIVKRNKRGEGAEIALGTNFTLENSENKAFEYEIDRSKVDKLIMSGEPFSSEIGLVTEPCVALRRKIKIKAGKDITLNLVLCVSEDLNEIIKTLDYYKIQENIKKEFNIAKAKAEEEARYLNLSRNDIERFNKILPYIVYQNPMKSLYMKDIQKKEFKQSDFWKYGISGDIPIILVTAKFLNDVYVVKEILKLHETLRVKGIRTDLVILDYEKNVYEQYVKEQIIQEILNLQIGYLQNISGGVFLLNANEIEDEELFKFRANIIINASKGSVEEAIKEMEEEYKRVVKNIGNETQKQINNERFASLKPNIDMEKLKFYNGFGGFSDDRKRIYCKIK